METIDIVTLLLIGLSSGIWTAFLQCIFRKFDLKHILPRLLLFTLLPTILWYLFAFGIITISQEASHSIPDWVGMEMLMTGFNVFFVSLAGAAMMGIAAIPRTIYVFTILLLSISIQIGLMLLQR
jgi:hypothetical protein